MKLTLLTIVLAQFLFIAKFIPANSQSPKSLAYVLQADKLANTKASAVAKLAGCKRDWIVIDAAYSQHNPWTPAEVKTIRNGQAGRKVISYLSIGEAESYRSYWDKSWKTGNPKFLLKENPNWKGNYIVKYWDKDWQNWILAEVGKIMKAGFDGVYLDIVDGFENFDKGNAKKINPDTKKTYRNDMVDWVKQIAAQARKTKSDALVIPQNGVQLLEFKDFFNVVSGAGVESLFTTGDKLRKSVDKKVLGLLKTLIAAQKPVFDVEYPSTKSNLKSQVQQKAKQQGFVWLVTDRPLKTLGTSGN